MMKKILILLFTLISGISLADKLEFSGIFTFGDSLTADRGYWISPGPVWPQFAHANYVRPGGGYANYAVGGLRSDEIRNSVFSYLNAVGGQADKDALYVIWGGTNDTSPNGASNRVVEAVQALKNAGAGTVVVSTLHPNPRRQRSFVDTFNNGLLPKINAATQNVIILDTVRLFDEMYSNPNSFGFSSAGAVLSDNLHFPSQTHEVFSDYLGTVLTGPTVISVAPEFVLSESNHHAERFLNFARPEDTDHEWIYEFDLNHLEGEMDGSADYYGGDFESLGGIFRFARQLEEGWVLGGSLGLYESEGSFEEGLGTTEWSQYVFGFHARKMIQEWICFADVFAGSISMDISRDLKLGALNRTETGSPDASNFTWQLGVKREFRQESRNLTWTPRVGVRGISVEADAYDEGNNSTSLAVESQERTSMKPFVGLNVLKEFDMKGKPSGFGVDISFESETDDFEGEVIEAGLVNLTGNTWTRPAFESDRSQFQASLFLVSEIKEDLNLGFHAGMHSGGDEAFFAGIKITKVK